ARDHFGLRPFFFALVGRTLIFSNTLNCVRIHPAVSNRLDELAIADFLIFGNAQDPDRTSFQDIKRLAPAHLLTVSNGECSVRRYWRIPEEDQLHFHRRRDYVDRFLELLELAVR